MADERNRELDPTGVALEMLKRLGLDVSEKELQPMTIVCDDGRKITLDPLKYRREREAKQNKTE